MLSGPAELDDGSGPRFPNAPWHVERMAASSRILRPTPKPLAKTMPARSVRSARQAPTAPLAIMDAPSDPPGVVATAPVDHPIHAPDVGDPVEDGGDAVAVGSSAYGGFDADVRPSASSLWWRWRSAQQWHESEFERSSSDPEYLALVS
jgi:hypothetical protein